MTDHTGQQIREWLAAEAADDDERADRLFSAVFADHVAFLAPPRPVWDAVATRREARRGGWRSVLQPLAGCLASAWGRAVAASVIAIGGLAAAAFLTTWLFDLLGVAVAAGPRSLSVLVESAAPFVAFVRHAWLASVAVGEAFGVAASTGPAAAVIALNLTIALGAAVGLSRLLSPEEE